MCYHKIAFRNPNWKKDDIRSRKSFYVPCRHCEECRQLITSEYAFRAQIETANCIAKNGLIYFNTFTYNDRFLPCLQMKDGSLISTWNKQHIQLFLKRLRKFFSYYYGIKSNLLRYMITSERGSNRVYKVIRLGVPQLRQATERPHYHSIIWLYKADEDFVSFTKKDGTEVSLPDWCNGLTKLSDVFPLAFQHFWSDPKTGKSYGNIDDELLCRTPALATKYVTKYINKQWDDRVYRIDLENIDLHYQNISRKDFLPFSLFSNGIGASYEPSIEELAGLKKVAFQSSEGKNSEIGLPRYYYKRICKSTIKKELRYTKFEGENWTPDEGYKPAYLYIFFDTDKLDEGHWFIHGQKIPFTYKTETVDTPIGEIVKSTAFDLSVQRLMNSILAFVRNPKLYTSLADNYNENIHKKKYSIDFHNLDLNTLNSKTAKEYIHMLSSDGDEFAIQRYVASKAPDICTRLGFAVTVLKNLLEDDYEDLQAIYPDTTGKDVLDDAIRHYFHEGIDLNNYPSVAIDIIYKFFADTASLISAVKRFKNENTYKNNKSKVMLEHSDLFKPHELDEDFSEEL